MLATLFNTIAYAKTLTKYSLALHKNLEHATIRPFIRRKKKRKKIAFKQKTVIRNKNLFSSQRKNPLTLAADKYLSR